MPPVFEFARFVLAEDVAVKRGEPVEIVGEKQAQLRAVDAGGAQEGGAGVGGVVDLFGRHGVEQRAQLRQAVQQFRAAAACGVVGQRGGNGDNGRVRTLRRRCARCVCAAFGHVIPARFGRGRPAALPRRAACFAPQRLQLFGQAARLFEPLRQMGGGIGAFGFGQGLHVFGQLRPGFEQAAPAGEAVDAVQAGDEGFGGEAVPA